MMILMPSTLGQIYQFMALHLVAVDGVACAGYASKFALNVLSTVKNTLV